MLGKLQIRPGKTLLLSLGGEWTFGSQTAEKAGYTRISAGFLKIHLMQGDIDYFLSDFTEKLASLPRWVKSGIPEDAVSWMKNRKKGFGIMVGMSQFILSPKFVFERTSKLEAVRVVWGRFFLHVAFFDFDRFWAGILKTAMFMKDYEKVSWIFKLEGVKNEIFGS